MCQGGDEPIRVNGKCICGPSRDDEIPDIKELLARLKEYRQNLKSELDAVNKKLDPKAIAEEGGD